MMVVVEIPGVIRNRPSAHMWEEIALLILRAIRPDGNAATTDVDGNSFR